MKIRKMMRPIIGSIFVLLVLGFTQVLQGQAVNGTLLGTVTDATGAAIPGAQVTATLTGTGAIHQSETNGSGNYTFPDMQPGVYTITVNAKGFKKAEQQNINLLANTSPRVDVALQPGNVSETIVVTTAPPVLQTDRADISTKIEAQAVMELPLTTNRNYQSLLNLVPGVAPAVFQHSQFFNASDSLQTEANGMPRVSNLYQIEGIDDDERTGLLQILIPPAEAIQSVDISTNNYEAELGRSVGAITNVTLKSGTSQFHGSAFEFIQNSAVNARSYFAGPLGHLSYNYYGGSIGGPIIKDKLFFFGDYLRTDDDEKASSTFTIPDARYYTANSSGNIDLSAGLVGTKGQIYDPATGDGSTAHPRTPFVNNQLPLNRVNLVSLTILQDLNAAAAKYGKLDSTKPLSAPTNNYTTNLPFTKKSNSYDIKIDFTPTEKNHLSGRFSHQVNSTYQAPAFGAFLGGPAGGGFEALGTQATYSTGGNWDHVFSPSFFTEARVGVAHLRNSANPNRLRIKRRNHHRYPRRKHFRPGVYLRPGGPHDQRWFLEPADRLLGFSAVDPGRIEHRYGEQLDQGQGQSHHQVGRRSPPSARRPSPGPDVQPPRRVHIFCQPDVRSGSQHQRDQRHRQLPSRSAQPDGPRSQHIFPLLSPVVVLRLRRRQVAGQRPN